MNITHAYWIVFFIAAFIFQTSFVVSESYDNCPNREQFPFIDAKCKVTTTDCTKTVCHKNILNTNLKITVKVKKCDNPIAIDVSVETSSYDWFEKFTSSHMSRDIPHSGSLSTKLRLRVSFDNTTTNIGFKVSIATGFEQHGRFNISSSTPLVDGVLKRSVNDCAPAIEQGHDVLSGGEIAGIVVGSVIGFVLLCVFCFWLVSYSISGRCCNELDGVV